jgi:hypothetical protein
MKLVVLSEAPPEEAAITILAESVLGVELTRVTVSTLRSRGGWPSVRDLLPVVFKQLYYHTDAEALIMVVDSDDSPIHRPGHDEAGGANPLCRLCLLRRSVAQVKSSLNPIPGRTMIRTALGLAVPAIEAWYRCGLDTRVNEATWARGLGGERIGYNRKSLKLDAYRMEPVPMRVKTAVAEESARRLVNDLESFERLFPDGFGALARDLRSWELG